MGPLAMGVPVGWGVSSGRLPLKRRKHVPMRTCIGCHQKQPKRELLRVVRTPAGTLELDTEGKHPGRGAYMCLNRTCPQMALEQRKLERALKCRVSDEDIVSLKKAAGLLLDGEIQAESDALLPEGEAVDGQAE